MSVDPDRPGRSGGTVADIGILLEGIAQAVGPASPMLGRVAAAVSIARLGSRLLPAGARLLRRHPVGSLLAVATMLGAVYLLRSPPISPRPRLGSRLVSGPYPRSGSRPDPRLNPRSG